MSPDLRTLMREKEFLKHQFPAVTAMNDPPTTYEGILRCEKGPVKELADDGVWPFVEYVRWQRYRLEIPQEYPIKPPVATWLTEIAHPNIVPHTLGAVCVSVLGDKWRPNLKLTAVINSLHYLLVDPNPESVFNHPRCLKAARVCREHGFPRKGRIDAQRCDILHFRILGENGEATTSEGDIVHFNIIPVPQEPKEREGGDILHFKIPRGREAEENET